MSEDDVPVVTTSKDIEDNEGELVHVVGMYRLMDVRKRADPPPVYKGHALVELEDGTRVCLMPPWSGDAIRPQEERDQYADQKVVVHGYIVGEAPPDPSGGASIVMPCMARITGVVPYELYEMSMQ